MNTSVRINNDIIRLVIDNSDKSLRKLASEAEISHTLLSLIYNRRRLYVSEETADRLAKTLKTSREVICLPENITV